MIIGVCVMYYRYIVECKEADGRKKKTVYYALDREDLEEQFYKEHFHNDFNILFKEGIYSND